MVPVMKALKAIIEWGWSPILITALALIGFYFKWEFWALALIIGIILVIGLILAVIRAGERQIEHLSMKLKQLAGYFSHRFVGTSSLSIFTIIDTLFNLEDPQLWEWARSCDMCARLFSAWCDSFTNRLENDTRTDRFRVYLRNYLNELWLLNSHYYEFVEQFFEIAEKIEIPPATKDQYNRFTMEYNTFVQNFRENIAELRKAARTEIEPPSVKLASELPYPKPFQTIQKT
jgi:hypothetical protein